MRVWLNGRVMPLEEAHISPFDRGFLFGDGVYEMVRFFDGIGMAMQAHLKRLERSLQLTSIKGVTAADAQHAMQAVLDAEGLRDAAVYLQITRGVAPTRSHLPPPGSQPTTFAFAVETDSLDSLTTPASIAASIQPDDRWLHCDIKSISLMGSILPALKGLEHGAEEPLLIRNGFLSEGGSSNVLIVKGDALITPAVDEDPSILHGTMRDLVLAAAPREGLTVQVNRVTEEDLRNADEILVASSRRVLASVTHLEGAPFRNGQPGPMATRLLHRMRQDLAAIVATAQRAAVPRMA